MYLLTVLLSVVLVIQCQGKILARFVAHMYHTHTYTRHEPDNQTRDFIIMYINNNMQYKYNVRSCNFKSLITRAAENQGVRQMAGPECGAVHLALNASCCKRTVESADSTKDEHCATDADGGDCDRRLSSCHIYHEDIQYAYFQSMDL